MKRIAKSVETEHFVRIKKIDAEKKIVYGEVYSPDVLDTWGDFMTKEDIEQMAHRYMQLASLKQTIDTNHDEQPTSSYPVESFIAREGDTEYTPGAWVLGTKIDDDEIWKKIKKGEINGYSFQALVRKLAVVVNIDMTPDKVGITEPNEDHEHYYWLSFDEDGRVKSGRTSVENGHFHEIKKGTATEMEDGHSHRLILGD